MNIEDLYHPPQTLIQIFLANIFAVIAISITIGGLMIKIRNSNYESFLKIIKIYQVSVVFIGSAIIYIFVLNFMFTIPDIYKSAERYYEIRTEKDTPDHSREMIVTVDETVSIYKDTVYLWWQFKIIFQYILLICAIWIVAKALSDIFPRPSPDPMSEKPPLEEAAPETEREG